jgi:hypothetical protein
MKTTATSPLLPEILIVPKNILEKKKGRPETHISRRTNSEPVRGRRAGKRTHYSDKEKLNALCVFAVCHNSRRAAEITKIPEGTIRAWKETQWWHEGMQRVHLEKDEELGGSLTQLIDKAVDSINDRLDNGNYVYNPKLDKLIRKPVDAKELAIVAAISVDKRQLLRGQPTSRVESVSQTERLKGLAEQFAQFTKAKEIIQEPEELLIEEIEDAEEDGETINEMFS